MWDIVKKPDMCVIKFQKELGKGQDKSNYCRDNHWEFSQIYQRYQRTNPRIGTLKRIQTIKTASRSIIFKVLKIKDTG